MCVIHPIYDIFKSLKLCLIYYILEVLIKEVINKLDIVISYCLNAHNNIPCPISGYINTQDKKWALFVMQISYMSITFFNTKATKRTINQSSIRIFKGLQYFKSVPQPQGHDDGCDRQDEDTNDCWTSRTYAMVRKLGGNMTAGVKYGISFLEFYQTREVYVDKGRNASISVGQQRLNSLQVLGCMDIWKNTVWVSRILASRIPS